MPVTSHCDYQFATAEQASGAIQTLLEVVTGGSADPNHAHDAECVTRCSVALASYAASKMVGHKPAVTSEAPPTTDREKAEWLKKAKAAADNDTGTSFAAAAAIPWMMILELAYQILRDWLAAQPA